MLNFFTPGFQYDLQHYFTIIHTCPQHFGCPMQFGGCNGGCHFEKMRLLFLLKFYRFLLPLRWNKAAVLWIRLLELFNWSLEMHAFGMTNCLPWAISSNFETKAVSFEVISKRLRSSHGNVLINKSTLNNLKLLENFQIFKMTSITASKLPLFSCTGT